VESAAIEGDDGVVSFSDLPERSQQLGFLEAGNELDRAGFVRGGFVLRRGVQDLTSASVGVDHRDADDLRGERAKAALLVNLGAASVGPNLPARQYYLRNIFPKKSAPTSRAELVEHLRIRLHQAHEIFGFEYPERSAVGARFGEAVQLIPAGGGRMQQDRLRM